MCTATDSGEPRLTFSLDGTFVDGQQCGSTTLNTWLDGAIIREREEGEVEQEPETGGGTPVIDLDDNLTYIDVSILPRAGGGGTRGGGGQGSDRGRGPRR